MWDHLLPGLRIKVFMTIALGLVYPLAMTGIAQVFFPHKANGSLIINNGKVIGSEIIGQSFARPEYFHPRPSSAGSGYDPTATGGSQLGPTSAKLIKGSTKKDDKGNEVVDFDGLSVRVVHYCVENELAYESSMTLDQFKDASGNLDDVKLIHAFNDPAQPLSFRAKARGIRVSEVSQLVARNTEQPDFGFLGESRVNVLKLNLALDTQFRKQ
jgi:K+-transporting ATPase ATPase C chain